MYRRHASSWVPGSTILVPAGFASGDSVTYYHEILSLLRESRLAHEASIEQQREFIRYMNSLNSWLAQDVRDRQYAFRDISNRVDTLRAEVAGRGVAHQYRYTR
ncbi:hypothetical protein SCHPADRAFT_902168 [Schizopora paradoxa]|uniref:Uncharacterized protein n=1 Tax=Schizopora paradoxa TaxID=27342 RepID=A0A0H2RVL4_9AGAM|nr:hypothetical protein SCHPADRAFT_902168 [Schizopora paradoxa]